MHVLVVLALFAVIGHSCVAPGHAHALTPSSVHESETPAADHSHSDGGAVHAASCEAVRSGAASVATPSALAATPLVSVATEGDQRRSRVVASAPVSASPPLYVTHRALLI
jgi:hypothetical protein